MENLIEALNIFKKYRNIDKPITCALKTLMIKEITKKMVSKEDQKRLNELDFKWDEEYSCWIMDIIDDDVKSLNA
jgi:transposase